MTQDTQTPQQPQSGGLAMGYLQDAELGLPWEGKPPTLRELRALSVPFGLRYKLGEAIKSEDLTTAKSFLQDALSIINAIEEQPSAWEEVRNLEGALREAEQDRDSAIDALTTTQADWTEERQQFADEVSAYQIKLREAEAIAAQMQEKWHRAEMLILEDADELELLREEAVEARWMAEMLANMPAYEAEADRAAWSLTMVAVMKQRPWFVDALQQPKAGAS